MIKLYYFFLIFTIQATTNPQLDYFIKEDTNNDGILSKSQFIVALTNLFKKEDIESNKSISNNFGREFLGKKKQKGKIKLEDIRQWIESNELENSFKSWKPSKPSTKPPPPINDILSPPLTPNTPSKSIQKPLKNNFPDF